MDTEAEAIAAGRTWRAKENYDRRKAQAMLKALLAEPATKVFQVFFNDPAFLAGGGMAIGDTRLQGYALGPVSPVTSPTATNHHNNHVHVGVRFDKTDWLDRPVNDAPAFS